jgi:uncharacterized protein (DUF2237 family)
VTAKNVLGGPLALCSTDPLTGWKRDGCCDTDAADRGLHVVCAVVTNDFLSFSKDAGNDLSTPRPEYNFPGLHDGDRWCLCAGRWEEARLAGFAPGVVLEATHERALEVTLLGHLQAHAEPAVS